MALTLTVTNAGRAALVNADNSGTAPVIIAKVGLTATAVTPTAADTVLPGEHKRVATLSGGVVADDTIHVLVRDESSDVYTVRSVGLYLADDTLFGIYGQAEVLLEKSAQALLLLPIDVMFADIAAASISFGDANFLNPPATTTTQGVVELATEAEAETGTDTVRAVTPKGMKSAVTSWLNSRLGAGAPSTFIKSLLTIASAAALRVELGIKGAALKDEGANNGLDADLLDGQHGSYYANVPDRLGYIPWGPNNDGAGSGLDAGMLAGQLPTYYTNIVQRLGFTPVNKAGDSMPGVLTVSDGGGNARLWPNGDSTLSRAGGTSGCLYLNAANTRYLFNNGSAYELPGQQLYVNGSVSWNAGNDGAGSGLDADLLDGVQGSAFARLDGSTRFTGGVAVQSEQQALFKAASGSNPTVIHRNDGANYYILLSNPSLTFNTEWNALRPLTIDLTTGVLSSANGQNFSGGLTSIGSIRRDASFYFDLLNGGALINLDYNDYQIYDRANDIFRMVIGGQNRLIIPLNGNLDFYGTQGFYFNGNLLMHHGNDGAGSGFDADLLDGYQSSDFAKYADFASSHAASGYQKLPGGLILQWGSFVGPVNSSVSVAFPTAFTSFCQLQISGQAGSNGDGTASENGAYETSLSLTGFTAWSPQNVSYTQRWIAIGK